MAPTTTKIQWFLAKQLSAAMRSSPTATAPPKLAPKQSRSRRWRVDLGQLATRTATALLQAPLMQMALMKRRPTIKETITCQEKDDQSEKSQNLTHCKSFYVCVISMLDVRVDVARRITFLRISGRLHAHWIRRHTQKKATVKKNTDPTYAHLQLANKFVKIT